MMMIPVHVIAFFLAILLLPTGVTQFTINVQSKTVQWTKQAAAWHAIEFPHDDWGMYSVTDKVVTVAGEGKKWKIDVAKFLTLPNKADIRTSKEIWTAKKYFGTPVTIKREKNKITLSQTKGVLFQIPATITWPKPKPEK